ncbi:MAG TPA: acyl-CoA dehydrogenase [bacterium]|nr:acyl-CoA dehydrogenase [bacterium]
MLSDEAHEKFRQKIQAFARDVVAHRAGEIQQKEEFPMDIVKEMGRQGWMGLPIPKAYGGAGLDNLSYIIAVEEISRVSGCVGITLAAHTSLVVWPIYTHGNEAQKKKYLVPLARGEHIGSFGLTEANAGSDAGATETMAVYRDGRYVINGIKRFITNGTWADTVILTASHDRSLGVHGISAFIVEKGTPGFKTIRKEDKLGLRASDTAELGFEDCEVPEENLLGVKNEGFKVFMETLDGGRISIGALALGEAQGALDAAVDYVKERGLGRSQAVQAAIADMTMDVSAARHLIYHAARLKDLKLTVTLEGAMAKLYASEVSMRVSSRAIDIMGMEGLTPAYSPERFFRDAKLNEIGEGTSEIQRIVIARQVLGKR